MTKQPKAPDQSATEKIYEARQREELANLDEQQNAVLKRTLRKRSGPRLLSSMRAMTGGSLAGAAGASSAGPSAGSLSGAVSRVAKQVSLVG